MRKNAGVVYATRIKIPYWYAKAVLGLDNIIEIGLCNGGHTNRALLTRKMARLLAKRINQCLDETVKK